MRQNMVGGIGMQWQTPNQQCQSTEGNDLKRYTNLIIIIIIIILFFSPPAQSRRQEN